MCRIYGYLGRGLDAAALDAARDIQLAGGPDRQRHVGGEGWGLGCNRLAIQDPSHGCQPFTNADGSLFAVFNGEIYNFRAVREELATHGVRLDGDSDGSVILPYYTLHGDAFVDRLEGMFSIAVVDLRVEPRLKLWCDPLGVKNVYYTADADGVAFSSELPGLRALLGKPNEVEPSAVDAYMNWQCLPDGMSWHTGVSTLLPGERLTHDGRTVRRERSSSLGAPRSGEEAEEYGLTSDGLGGLLTHEVARMSLQEAPIAVQLSGGLDSSALATLLSRRRTDVTGFHVTHEGDHPSDELSFAREAATHAGVPLEVIELRQAELPELVPAMVAALGTPNATPHSVSAFVLFREMARNGFRVCFTGDGADEQFGGYRRYSTALAGDEQHWPRRYLDRLSLVPEHQYRDLYTPAYREWLDTHGDSRRRALELLDRPAPSRLERILDFDRTHKLPALNLRKLDHLSMAHGIECRVPYCQPAVTRFARALPDELKVVGSHRKRVLWDVGAKWIPEAVRGRDKQPFTFPVGAWLRPGTVLWDFVVDVLDRPRLCSSGFLSEPAVRRVVTEHTRGADHARLLWGLMILELSFP
ncbi:asparagine synthase (glutamine-hydrolyzing) [Streptomyces sp. NPDC005438]|uniref:asparagine synthase (glutamine-hydrolyzing) n=1 Tax=Streptomyces sp. NPDC005438 TaxID=3156880 RepID=UPI0033ACF7F3